MEFQALRPAYQRLDDYFGLWSMHEPAFAGLFSLVSEMDLRDHVAQRMLIPEAQVNIAKLELIAKEKDEPVSRISESDSGRGGYQMADDGIAVIRADGTLMKATSSFSTSASTVELRQAIRAAVRDSSVKAICMVFDSPGGTVAGTQDLAAEIAAANSEKPTAAYCEDLCASAAYWCASQAGFVACGPSALVGSIGTFMAVRDSSGMAEDMKIKVHVIKAGDFKGAGTPGTKITDEQLANWQAMVDQLNTQFIAGVASGRKMSAEAVSKIADGRVHVGAAAKDLGLVDAVQSFDETMRQLSERAGAKGNSQPKKGAKMSGTENPAGTLTGSVAATLDELTAHLVGADDSFLMKQLKGKVTLAQAQSNWLAEMNSRLQAKDKEIDGLKAAGGAIGTKPGTEPLGTPKGKSGTSESESEDTGNAVEQFDEAVSTLMKGGMSRFAAVKVAARKNPELHQRFLAATNPSGKSRRQLAEKYA